MIDSTPVQIQVSEEIGQVSALLLRPPSAKTLLVLGHGAGAGMKHANMEAIAQSMAARNLATLRYQFPFMERGGGRDKHATSMATIAAAIEKAKELAPDLPLLAGGHSFGGRMTSHFAATESADSLKGLIFFAFPLHAPGKEGTERAAHLKDISQPMLFLSGTRDTLARQALLLEVVESLGPQAELHWLDTANHGYKILKRTRTNPLDVFTEMGEVVEAWLPKLG